MADGAAGQGPLQAADGAVGQALVAVQIQQPQVGHGIQLHQVLAGQTAVFQMQGPQIRQPSQAGEIPDGIVAQIQHPQGGDGPGGAGLRDLVAGHVQTAEAAQPDQGPQIRDLVVLQLQSLKLGEVHQRLQIADGVIAQAQRGQLGTDPQRAQVPQAHPAQIQHLHVRSKAHAVERHRQDPLPVRVGMDGAVGQRRGQLTELLRRQLQAQQAQGTKIAQLVQRCEVRRPGVVQDQIAQAAQGRQGAQIRDRVPAQIQAGQAAEALQLGQVVDAVAAEIQSLQGPEAPELGQDGVAQARSAQIQLGQIQAQLPVADGHGLHLPVLHPPALQRGDAAGDPALAGVHLPEDLQGHVQVPLGLVAVHHEHHALVAVADPLGPAQQTQGVVVIPGLIGGGRLLIGLPEPALAAGIQEQKRRDQHQQGRQTRHQGNEPFFVFGFLPGCAHAS